MTRSPARWSNRQFVAIVGDAFWPACPERGGSLNSLSPVARGTLIRTMRGAGVGKYNEDRDVSKVGATLTTIELRLGALIGRRRTAMTGAPALGRSQVVRQRILIPPFPGSNPGAPASQSSLLAECAGRQEGGDVSDGYGHTARSLTGRLANLAIREAHFGRKSLLGNFQSPWGSENRGERLVRYCKRPVRKAGCRCSL